jgi:hypothetical protein
MIDPNQFVTEMERHWGERLGNVSSGALRQVWQQLACAFNDHIADHDNPRRRTRWTVLQPPTGSGKSQGTAVYCGLLSKLLPEAEHPGVLIVTRLIADADLVAHEVNTQAGREVAASYHSESEHKLGDMQCFPVLVVTHRAYELALDRLGRDGSIQQTWPFFHNWQNGTRKLVVIDEALDIVEHSQGELEGLRQTLAALPQNVLRQFPYEASAIKAVCEIMERMEAINKAKAAPEKEKLLLKRMVTQGNPPNFDGLRAALHGIAFDYQMGRKDALERERLRKMHDARIKALHNIFRSWVYYARVETQHTLNTACLLVPDDTKGAVVLDATASSNVLYELFDDAQVLTPPEGSRNYQNVTLNVSRGHKVGKVYMRNNAPEVTQSLLANLNEHLAGRKVFVCCHKAVEPILASHETTFEMMTGHWGSVDGSNAYRECDTAVIFGLPYRPDYWTANVYFALRGPQDTPWLTGTERPFGTHKDIRNALKVGQMVVEIVQAINRVRCRKVIDERGNCPATHIYILLPNEIVADEILNGIVQEMPGVQVKTWELDIAKRGVRRSNHEAALMTFIKNLDVGRYAVTHIRNVLGISTRTWERLTQKLRDDTGSLADAMKAASVRYEVSRTERTQRAFLIKDGA